MMGYWKQQQQQQHEQAKLALVSMMLLMIWSATSPAQACQANGGECRVCIVEQLKFGCPPCVPVIRCMARCLWGGRSRPVCVKRCDCNGGGPKLSDCKKCLWRCKCSCAA